MRPPAAVGVDLGGSWIRLCALDEEGRRRHALRRPAPSPEALPGFLRGQLRSWGAQRTPLAVASRGVWAPAEQRRLRERLRRAGLPVSRVMSDVEAAWLAAFPGQGAAGILVAAGTGSIACARDRDGCCGRSGGLGPLLGDEGSAFWIGREWIRAGGPGREPRAWIARQGPEGLRPAVIARLAADVLTRSRRGDRTARRILREAQAHLAALAFDLHSRLHWPDRVPVSGAGRLLEDPGFRRGFAAALRRRSGRRLVLVQSPHTAAEAAARSVLRSR